MAANDPAQDLNFFVHLRTRPCDLVLQFKVILEQFNSFSSAIDSFNQPVFVGEFLKMTGALVADEEAEELRDLRLRAIEEFEFYEDVALEPCLVDLRADLARETDPFEVACLRVQIDVAQYYFDLGGYTCGGRDHPRPG